MQIPLVGTSGQPGRHLRAELVSKEVTPPSHENLEITDPENVRAAPGGMRPWREALRDYLREIGEAEGDAT